MVTTKKRRQVVTHLLAAYRDHDVSARRACRLIGLSRSRWHYRTRRGDDAELRERLCQLAAQRPRWGYQQLHILLRREGRMVNHKKVLRLYREEGLAVLRRRRKKRVAIQRVPLPVPSRRTERWSMDFIQVEIESWRRDFNTLRPPQEPQPPHPRRVCPTRAGSTTIPHPSPTHSLTDSALGRTSGETAVRSVSQASQPLLGAAASERRRMIRQYASYRAEREFAEDRPEGTVRSVGSWSNERTGS